MEGQEFLVTFFCLKKVTRRKAGTASQADKYSGYA
jgi:hypothetical protein